MTGNTVSRGLKADRRAGCRARSRRLGFFGLVLGFVVLRSTAGAAQGPTAGSASVDIEQALAAQHQLIRELAQRLDAQEAANTLLQQRVIALERALKAASADPNGGPQAGPAGEQDPSAGTTQTKEDVSERLEERLDALPRLVGYYDFEFFKESRPQTFGEFRQHHVSLHVSKEHEKYRAFSEIELEYGTHVEATGNGELEEAHGELIVEQAWAEYAASDLFTLRGGRVLTPNHWNVNHYPNIVLSTRRPLMVRNVYDTSFVGVMGYGTKHWGSVGLGYNAYVANGHGAFLSEHDDAQHDDNDAKAVGGTLSLKLSRQGLFDDFNIAINGYRNTPAGAARTHVWGIESQAHKGPFELLLEFARRQGQENRSGVYVQSSYRVTDRVAAFYRYDRLTRVPAGATRANTWGLNARPIPPVSLKFEFFRTNPPREQDSNGIASSLAVAF